MKNMSKFQRKICISQIIVSIVLVATVFLMPFPMEGGRTFGIQLLYSMIAKNGFEFDYIIFGIYVILSIFHIMRIVLLFRGKSLSLIHIFGAEPDSGTRYASPYDYSERICIEKRV